MASYPSLAPKGAAAKRATINGISNLRFKPFTGHASTSLVTGGRQLARKCLWVARAVEAPAEGGVEQPDLDFSYTEAKKGNVYEPSDVENALKFYFEGAGVAPPADGEFVSNVFGVEDSDCFSDLDNNEGYEADEFLAAGIPEAAPKRRRRDINGDAEADTDDAGIEALDKLKDAEDQMVLEAELEEMFGKGYNKEDDDLAAGARSGMWDWLADFSEVAKERDLAQLSADEGAAAAAAAAAAARRVDGSLPSDVALLSDIARVTREEVPADNADVLDMLGVSASDGLTDEDITSLNFEAAMEEDTSDVQPIAEADLARIDSLLAEDVPDFTLDSAVVVSSGPLAVELPSSQAAMDAYLAAIKKDSDAGIEFDAAQSLAAGAALEVVSLKATADAATDALLTQVSSLGDVAPLGDLGNFNEADELLITADEDADTGIQELRAEFRGIDELEQVAEVDLIPNDETIEYLSNVVSQAEAYMTEEEQHKAAGVDEVLLDIEDELLDEGYDDESETFDEITADEGVWAERIVELTRVTKVVKGGKIMGFRCVAVVGNGQGLVGVGCQAGRDVQTAVKRTLVNARKNIVQVPLVGAGTIPHKAEEKYHAAHVVLVPASDGTGCIAGGAVRSVLELAGVQNILAKRLGTRSALNNARCTVKALQSLKTLNEVAKARGVPMEKLMI